jgi:thioester reductase-like protein
MKMTSVRHPTARRIYGDIPAVLHGSTILITGAAGLVGTQLLYRLLYDSTLSGAINRVIAVIRAKTAEDALKRLPETLRYFATQPDAAASSTNSIAKLVVLNGDCARPDFGLDPVQLDLARQADIVINAAADTRFMLPLVDAIGGVVRMIRGSPDWQGPMQEWN